MTSVRKARAELKKLKEAAKGKLPNGGIIFVNLDRGETREQVSTRLGIDPQTEGLIFVEIFESDLRL
jgi:hypothetical protein